MDFVFKRRESGDNTLHLVKNACDIDAACSALVDYVFSVEDCQTLPGEWAELFMGDIDDVTPIGDLTVKTIKGYPQWDSPEMDAELEANARLIAAAPELLEALQEAEEVDTLCNLMKRIERRRPDGPNGIAVGDDADAKEWKQAAAKADALLDKRRAVIAKALGASTT